MLHQGDYYHVQCREEGFELTKTTISPCYRQMSNNVPTDLIELKINSWKPNTPPIVNHRIIKDYIQDTATKYNIPDCTLYKTRVDRASKIQNIWQIQTTTLTGRGSEAKKKSKHWVCSDLLHYWIQLTQNRNSIFLWLRLDIITPAKYLTFLD